MHSGVPSKESSGEWQGGSCLLGFRYESTMFHSRNESAVGLMEAAARRDNLVPHGGKIGGGEVGTSSLRLPGPNQSEDRENERQGFIVKIFSRRC